MILDGLFENYPVEYPFQITRFRFLYEHRWEGPYLFLGERHNFWEFTCVLEGEVEVVQDGKIFLLKPGSFIGSAPMVFHSCRNVEKRSRLLNFSFEHTGALPEKFSQGIFYLTPTETEELAEIFQQLCAAYTGEKQDQVLGAEGTYALGAFLLRMHKNHGTHQRVSNSRSGVMYRRLVESMREGLYENLTLGQIAQRNSISVTTVKELFAKYAGVNPKRYYSDMRGNEALRLLEEGMEISEITEKMNYSSANYFSYSFKRQFSLPPGQYRKRDGETTKG